MMTGESERYDDRREWKVWWQERVKDMMIRESERYDWGGRGKKMISRISKNIIGNNGYE